MEQFNETLETVVKETTIELEVLNQGTQYEIEVPKGFKYKKFELSEAKDTFKMISKRIDENSRLEEKYQKYIKNLKFIEAQTELFKMNHNGLTPKEYIEYSEKLGLYNKAMENGVSIDEQIKLNSEANEMKTQKRNETIVKSMSQTND